MASLAGCLPPSGAPGRTPAALDTPGSAFRPQAEGKLEILELVVLPGADALTWHAVGLARNAGSVALADTEVEVEFQASGGARLGVSVVPLPLSYLPPGESSPFLAPFTGEPAPSTASARLASFHPTAPERAVVGILAPTTSAFRTAEGHLGLLMRIENPHDQAVRVGEVAAILRDGEGRLAGAAAGVAGVTGIDPGGSATWLLVGEASPAASPALAFTDASLIPELSDPQIRLASPLVLSTTDQGLTFALGEIVNQGETLCWARGVVVLQTDGEPASLAPFASPLPLRPMERLAFALSDFPRQVPTGSATASLEIDRLASEPAEGNVVLLSLEIIQVEQIGSSVFARGTIGNPTGGEVLRPSVLAAIHATDGRLLGAGWATPQERLGSPGAVEFRFQIPLPAGFDLEAAEFDWRALGLAP